MCLFRRGYSRPPHPHVSGVETPMALSGVATPAPQPPAMLASASDQLWAMWPPAEYLRVKHRQHIHERVRPCLGTNRRDGRWQGHLGLLCIDVAETQGDDPVKQLIP